MNDHHPSPDPATRQWLAARPAFAGGLDADGAALRLHLAAGARLRAMLPARPRRDAAQDRAAQALDEGARAWRHAFLRMHAGALYARLTSNLQARLDIAELAQAAAGAFPGLLPDAAQLERESSLAQADKEGWEIDQGIFFSEVLADPRSGTHLVESMLRPGKRALALEGRWRAEGRLRLAALELERRDGAAYLTVRNGAQLNAEDNQLISDMETAVDLVLLDDGVRVCVLRGGEVPHPKYAGRRVFSAGINLKHLHAGRIGYVDFLLRRELGYISKMWRGLVRDDADGWHSRHDKPWLAVVDSFAIGGGAQLLLVCDRVLAAADSWFSLPAAQEGIVPGVANLRLTRAVGARLARRIVLDGHAVRAGDAESLLLFDEVCAPERLDAAIAANVARLASPAVVANRRMLNLADEPLDAFRRYMAGFALEQATRLYGSDVLEKVARTAAPADATQGSGHVCA